ncbi:PIN domain-containing protein [Geoglobus sp.]
MKVFLDTNFLVNLIVETDFTDKARKILKEIADFDLFCSVNVIEETVYILRRLLKRDNRYIARILRDVMDNLEVEILECTSAGLFFEVLEKYDLLPNDALIAATCKHYGIKKIATFDEDFKRVDFLEIVQI